MVGNLHPSQTSTFNGCGATVTIIKLECACKEGDHPLVICSVMITSSGQEFPTNLRSACVANIVRIKCAKPLWGLGLSDTEVDWVSAEHDAGEAHARGCASLLC